MATGSAVILIGESLAPRWANDASSSVFWRSARIASATPGYCTLTTTSRPSCRRAAWTRPILVVALVELPGQPCRRGLCGQPDDGGCPLDSPCPDPILAGHAQS